MAPCYANAKYFDIKSLTDITQFTSQLKSADTLYVFDIDNTLLTETPQELYIGSPEWFDWQKQEINDQKPDAITSNMNQFYPFNDFILKVIETVSCEKNVTSAFVKKLEEQGDTIIAATARDPSAYYNTMNQLANNHITLSPHQIVLQNPNKLGKGTYYASGSLFLTGQDKAQYVWNLLKATDNSKIFKNIVFVDDTLANITNFVNEYNQYHAGVNVYAFHYNHEVNQVKIFHTKILTEGSPTKQQLVKDDRVLYRAYQVFNPS